MFYTALGMVRFIQLFPIFPSIAVDRTFGKRKLSDALAISQNNRLRASFVAEGEQFVKKGTIKKGGNTQRVRVA